MIKHLSEDQLISYVCRTLTDAQREKMEIHFGTCPECRAGLAGYETLHRRLGYSVMDWRRGDSMSPAGATFAVIAPRVRRARRMTMFWAGSKQFIYAAATLAVLVVLVVGLALFLGGVHAPVPGPALQSIEYERPLGTYTEFPLGFYVTTVTSEDSREQDIYGDWELMLFEGGRYSFTLGRGVSVPVAEGHYTFTPDQIVFTGEKGSYSDACIELGAETGAYKWAFDGHTLTLTTVEDECPGRNDVIVAHPWTKMEDDLPLGTYATKIVVEDGLQYGLVGTWELILTEKNRWSQTHLGSFVAEGRYSLTPDQIVFTHERGPYTYTCSDIGAETGIYRWVFDGQALTLTTVKDECLDRNKVWTAHPWSMQD